MLDLEELDRRYAADVHRFAHFLSGDRAAADDITSETFLRAWSSSAPIREATVKGDLFTIASNVFLHDRRLEKRRDEMPEDVVSPEASVEETTAQSSALDAVLSEGAVRVRIHRARLKLAALVPKEALLSTPPPPLSPSLEQETLERTKRYNAWRWQLLAFTIAYGLFPLAFVWRNGGVSWIMFRDNPKQAVMFWIAAAGCAIARWVLGWRLRTGR